MPLNATRARQLLKDFNFPSLFLEELGWDKYNAPLEITFDGQTKNLQAVAQKRGMVAFRFSTPAGGRLPEYAVRRKIEQQVAKAAHEHIIIFTDAAQTTQIWQWVKREPGKPAACREHPFHKSQTGDALLQKLEPIAFSLDEEETLSLTDVTRRARTGFDVERVTKRFYDQFQKEHAAFLKFITGITESADHEWYASVMLNRLMFVYFIQRKGFLDGDRDYLRNRLNRCQREKGKDKFYSFYRYFLLRLFQEGFGKRPKERAPDLEKLIGRIPYLNGGFFEQHDIEKHYGDDIQIPDKAFERIFDYFDQYQWHLDERPLRADNEINPDVLGYIFEKYINQKQMGAYYTKEDITEYISKNTVLPFLFDAARPKCKIAFENPNGPTVWNLLKASPDRYIYDAMKKGVEVPLPKEIEAGIKDVSKRDGWNKSAPAEFALPTEIWREVIARRKRSDEIRKKLATGEVRDINDLVTLNLDIRQFAQDVIENCEGPELLRAFWHTIEKLSVLDPTCGSGAFLFAALNILEPLYEACLDRMEAFVADLDRSGEKHRPEKFSDFRAVLERVAAHPNRRYFIFKSIILNNLFGVDIMEEAVEICKLRLFLKLAAQVEPDAGKDNFGIEPLPDIDFNIRAGNTLVGYATADEVKRCMKEFGGGQMRLGVDDDLNSYTRFAEKVELADRAFRRFREMQTEHGMDAKDFVSAKQTLRERLKTLKDELNRYLATDYGVKTNDKASFAKWLNTYLPFHWFVEFYGIISTGGFDVIIGNPPYVEYKDVKRDYQIRGYKTEECGNLYAFTWERSVSLANSSGKIGLIIPVASVCTDGYASLRQVWLSSGDLVVSNFNDRPGKLFDGLEHIRLAIVLLAKRKSVSHRVHTTTYNKWFTEAREHLFHSLRHVETTALVRSGSMPKVGSEIESSILSKTLASPKTLHHFSTTNGRHRIYYTRKLSWFVQILDFVPSITDEQGRKREPSELKEVRLGTSPERDAFLCILNSSLFYWFLTVWSDCRNLNKREVLGVPFDFTAAKPTEIEKLGELASKLTADFQGNSRVLEMNYADWGTMKIQCIYPKFSKPILDEIDRVLARHYGFTPEELDFILNYDIKYRLGRDNGDEEE